MRWVIVLQPAAQREMDRLGRRTQDAIVDALSELAMGRPIPLIRVKTGRPGEARLRVGKYRIRLVLDHASHTIYVEHVGLRNHIYD